MFWLFMQDGVNQVPNCEELLYFMPELIGLGGCSFAFGLKFGAFRLPSFYGKGFIKATQLALGQVEAAEFWFVVFLKLLPALFEFDLLELIVDGLGLDISLRVALEFLELFDSLTVGFDGVLERLPLCVDFSDFLLQVLQGIELFGLEKVHRLTECFEVFYPRLLPCVAGKGQRTLVSLSVVVAEQRNQVGAGVTFY